LADGDKFWYKDGKVRSCSTSWPGSKQTVRSIGTKAG